MSPILTKIERRDIEAGDHVIFETVVSGIPAPTVLWFLGHTLVKNTGRVTVRRHENACTFKISRCSRDDSGMVVARAHNEAGFHSVYATLKVNGTE